MSDNKLIIEFTQRFDSVIKDDFPGLRIENEENKDLLALVSKISKIDYSIDSKISNNFKEQLLIKLQNDIDELSDAELDYAAGGLDNVRAEKDPEK